MEFLIMAGSDFYRTGKGIFGGRYGSYGRYGVGQTASNLSAQFDNAENVEETQRRRFKRKRESGYVGNGYWFGNYPYMIGAMGSANPDENIKDQDQPMSDSGQSASDTNGSGSGGTATGFVGGLGS
jgi:hypothetical protein